MKKIILAVSLSFVSTLFLINAEATEPNKRNIVVTETNPVAKDKTRQHIQRLYNQIDFGKGEQLDVTVFEKAMTGYLNLKAAGKLNQDKEILTVADFSQSSTKNRLWVIDLDAKKVLYNTYVAHGQGSGGEFATRFSNVDGTHASSMGFFVTGNTYVGQHGNSLRLNGMDKGYNDAALRRAIVIHAADYVNKNIIKSQGRLGRSWGCPALAPELAQPIINKIKDGTCLFIYTPDKSYQQTAVWLNKKPVVGEDYFAPQPLADNETTASDQHQL